MSWLLSVDDVEPLRAVFGDISVISPMIDVHRIIVDRDGPDLRIVFDLHEYPEEPPAKWSAAGSNTVQVTLSLGSLTSLSLTDVETTMVGTIQLDRDEKTQLVTVVFETAHVRLRAECRYTAITAISAYLNDPDS